MSVRGLSEDDAALFERLVRTWGAKRLRNALRQQYRDMHVTVKNLGASVPPYMRDQFEIVCGWPNKAVTSLSSRCMWDGVTSPSGSEDPLGVTSILEDNRFDLLVPELIDAALTYCCAFVVALPGDVSVGDPEIVVTGADALWATGVWDKRRRALEAGLLIDGADDLGRPTSALLVTATHVTRLVVGDSGWVALDVMPHALGRVPMEPLPYAPSLGRPFGRSRISREVMSITDRVIRAGYRTEVSSDLYTAPALLLLGADESAFVRKDGSKTPLWSWYMTRFKSLPKDEDGELPKLEVIPQQSMEPFNAMKRALAGEFSAATNLPISALGIVQENPSSAEAIYAAKEDLVVEATNATRTIGYGLNRIMQDILCLRDGIHFMDMPDEMRRVHTRWRNPAMPSVVSQSDAMVKQIGAIPELALTDVALEELGYSQEQIMRIRSQVRRASAGSTLDRLLSERKSEAPTITAGPPEAGDDGD
ncbi:phage portal protein [Actinomyces bowdenii]|uniref:phage portal protein n=1 Tax=Actinomyces bowdenii TaxID=131109 RepID=UPI00214B89EF|nr:phage portal protein [Actinomyces bowdenii]MCR2051440.1 phage portal protein [Actinomyces bowdenii]